MSRDPSVRTYGYLGYGGYYGNYGYSAEDEEYGSGFTNKGGVWRKTSATTASVTRTVKRGAKNIRSCFDRYKHVMKNVDPFDPETGFDDTETEEMKINRILLTFLSEEMSENEKAELVLRAYEINPDDVEEFNFNNRTWGL